MKAWCETNDPWKNWATAAVWRNAQIRTTNQLWKGGWMARTQSWLTVLRPATWLWLVVPVGTGRQHFIYFSSQIIYLISYYHNKVIVLINICIFCFYKSYTWQLYCSFRIFMEATFSILENLVQFFCCCFFWQWSTIADNCNHCSCQQWFPYMLSQ